MSLTNTQLNELAKRMGFKLEAVVFKSELEDMKLKHNVPYICNIQISLMKMALQMTGPTTFASRVIKM